jgi:hypothetical protein
MDNAGYTLGTVYRKSAPTVKTLKTDSAYASTTQGNVVDLLHYPNTPGLYLLEVEGSYTSSATTAGLGLGVQGNVSTIGTVKGQVDIATSNTASYKSAFGWAEYVGAAPSAAGTEYPFKYRAYVEVTAFPNGGNLGIHRKALGAGTVTIKAGTTSRLTRLS